MKTKSTPLAIVGIAILAACIAVIAASVILRPLTVAAAPSAASIGLLTSYGGATPTPTPCSTDYTYTTSTGGSVVQGTNLVPGSQCGRCTVPVTLPFPFTFYGQTYTSANVLNVGNVQFATTDTSTTSCLPAPQLGPAILPNWDTVLDTSFTSPCQQILGRPCGVYTSVSGSAPNRIFNIEWLARRSGSNTYTARFELRLYETTGQFDFVYANIIPPPSGRSSSVGVQNGSGAYTNFACFVDNSIGSGLVVSWHPPTPCGPTYTPTPTRTPTCPPLRVMVGQNQPAKPAIIHSNDHATSRFAPFGKSRTQNSKLKTQNSTDAPITFALDDGTRETSIGFGSDTTETAALWLNRFTPPSGSYPIALDGIQVLWPDQSETGDNLPGKTARLLVYQDTDGDGNPANASLLGQVNVTIGITETYENYPINITAPGPTGDLYIGFEDLWAESGHTPRMFPASQDTTASQARSWIAAMGSGAAPDINNLDNNDLLATIDSFDLPGNWMVRATGNSQSGGCPPTSTPTYTHTPTFTRTPTNTASPTPTSTPVCPLAWRTWSAPNVGSGNNYLYSVSAVSANDAWAVGYYVNGSSNQTLTQHWDGTQWSVVSSPNPGTSNSLHSVVAITSNDVWAVGGYTNGSQHPPLVIHWDGTQWSQVASPSPGSSSDLQAITAISASDIWAVGDFYTGSTYQTLTMHWDGSQWNVVNSPNVPGSGNHLNGVAAVGPNDVWAVGTTTSSTPQTLTMHWDGTAWTIVPSPNIATYSNYLNAVAAVSSNDVWAVGMARYQNTSQTQALNMHWNGTQWSIVPSPILGGEIGLNDVVALGPNDVYAVGSYNSCPGDSSLIERWNGTSWTQITSANVPTYNTRLLGIDALSPTDMWAVGYYNWGGVNAKTVAERYSSSCPPLPPGCCADISASGTSGCGSPNSYGFTYTVTNNCSVALTGRAIVELELSNNPNGPWVCRTSADYYNITFQPGANTLNSAWSITPPTGYSWFRTRLYAIGTNGCWTLDVPTAANRTCNITPTPTPTSSARLVGHVVWQGPPAQPSTRQQLPVTLTLKLGSTEVNYPSQNTDASGFFTVFVGTMPNGIYQWRVKGSKYLANVGSVSLIGVPFTNVEMGTLLVGDCNNDNVVNTSDFSILKGTFGKSQGDPGYDTRADFTNDNAVNASDFNLLKVNFGQGGAPPVVPGG